MGSCFAVSLRALFTSHLPHNHVLSDISEDTDVSYVLARKPLIPEYIGTQVAVYEVNPDGTIRVVERIKKKH